MSRVNVTNTVKTNVKLLHNFFSRALYFFEKVSIRKKKRGKEKKVKKWRKREKREKEEKRENEFDILPLSVVTTSTSNKRTLLSLFSPFLMCLDLSAPHFPFSCTTRKKQSVIGTCYTFLYYNFKLFYYSRRENGSILA